MVFLSSGDNLKSVVAPKDAKSSTGHEKEASTLGKAKAGETDSSKDSKLPSPLGLRSPVPQANEPIPCLCGEATGRWVLINTTDLDRDVYGVPLCNPGSCYVHQASLTLTGSGQPYSSFQRPFNQTKQEDSLLGML